MRVKRQGSVVHGTAGWLGSLPDPVSRCTRSPEMLQSGTGVMRISDRNATPGACTASSRRGRTAAPHIEGSCLDAGAVG